MAMTIKIIMIILIVVMVLVIKKLKSGFEKIHAGEGIWANIEDVYILHW